MHLPRPRPLPPAVPAAALANLALLLVFFFFLATRYDPQDSATELPRAPGPFEAPAGAVTIVVERGPDDALEWRVEREPGKFQDLGGPEGLYFEASRIVDKDSERTFLLRVDGSIRFAVVDDVLEMLRKAGVKNVVLGARPTIAAGA
ncbi:MAG TPA: biopolymer transporter ExbD [Candidatus Polarisedimenticolaceae bacterium]|nr:biopolymer transporter ExbD [Candidatus Polarisedimenticolaceae bacterium]